MRPSTTEQKEVEVLVVLGEMSWAIGLNFVKIKTSEKQQQQNVPQAKIKVNKALRTMFAAKVIKV